MLAKLCSSLHLEMSCFLLFNKDGLLALIKKSFSVTPLAIVFVGRGCR